MTNRHNFQNQYMIQNHLYRQRHPYDSMYVILNVYVNPKYHFLYQNYFLLLLPWYMICKIHHFYNILYYNLSILYRTQNTYHSVNIPNNVWTHHQHQRFQLYIDHHMFAIQHLLDMYMTRSRQSKSPYKTV